MLGLVKRTARTVVDSAIASMTPWIWRSDRPQLLILTYHRVLPVDYPELDIVEPGMMVSDRSFEMHLEILSKKFTPVHLSDWLHMRAAGDNLPQRAVAITFDDGWQDNYQYAFPILKKFEFPATIFAVSGLLDSDTSFWPERLARALRHRSRDGGSNKDSWLSERIASAGLNDADAMTRAEISRVIAATKAESDSEINANLDRVAVVEGIPKRLVEREILNFDEVREMSASGLVHFGSHTKNHIRLLPGLADDELQKQVLESRQQLAGLLDNDIKLFCYPNGDMSDAAYDLVKDNYSGACTTKVGWNTEDSDAHLLRRLTIHEGRSGSPAAFLSRISQR